MDDYNADWHKGMIKNTNIFGILQIYSTFCAQQSDEHLFRRAG
jgi:hypothetical protein